MGAIDWSRGDLCHTCTVLMVDPGNLVDVRGELRGVTGGKLNLQYYGDTRMGAELTTMGDHGWDGSAALRIMHTVSDYTGVLLVEPLFTGYVTAAPWEGEGDGLKVAWTLKSGIHALEASVAETGYGIAAGSKALTIVAQICGSLGRPYRIDSTANEYVYSSNKVHEAGKAYSSILFDVCNSSDNRMSVDASGFVTFSGYVAPSTKGVDFEAYESGPRGVVVGDTSGEMGGLKTPSRVVVRAESGENSVTASASVQAGTAQSQGVRGYRLDRFESVSDLSPFTTDAARALAEQYLANDLNDLPTIGHGLMYRPLREGDIELLTTKDGSRARWMVSGAELDLTTWMWDLSLKGGWA